MQRGKNVIYVLSFICIGVGILFNQENMVYFLSGNTVFLVTMLFVFGMAYKFMLSRKNSGALINKTETQKIYKFLSVGFLFLTGMILLVYVMDAYRAYMVQDLYAQRNLFAFLVLVIVASGLFCLQRYWEDKFSEQDIIWFIFLLGLAIRIIYLLYTPITERQNDIGSFTEGNTNHLGYVYYLYTYGKLPDIDPREALQFYNPPLHYIICAGWLRLQTTIGVSLERALENLQLLTLFYSGCIMIVADKIALKLRLFGGYRILSLGLVAFTPYLFMGAGAVNLDTLLTLLMVIAIYCTLCWMEKPCIKWILMIAISLGFGIMTKITAGVLAVPIGVIFCWNWIKERKEWKKYLSMYGIFAVVIFPIALWFPIKNLILFNMPVVWSPPTSGMEQYTGNFTLWERFFDFDLIQFKTLCVSWYEGYWEGANYVEHNIPLAFLKHLAFSDWPYCMYTTLYYLISAVLLMMIAFIIISCIVLLVYWTVRGKETLQNRVFVLLTVIVYMGAYLYFALSKPYVAAMNIRYVLPVVIMLFVGGNLGLRVFMQKMKPKYKSWVRKLICVAGVFYGSISIGLFCLFMIKA